MKINQECIQPLAGKTTQKESDRRLFEQLLSPARQQAEGQFYWQHQQTLQVSCLTFHALQQQNKTRDALQQSTVLHKEAALALAGEKMPRLSIQPQIVTKTDELVNKTLVNKSENTLTKTNKTELSTYEVPGKNTFRKQNLIPKTSINYTQRQQATYKNHHIFIETDQAEIALNSAQIEQQELKKLIPALKQALRDKKIHLQKLIIDGEAQ